MSRAQLADAILIAHFGFVLFVVLGFALVLAGGALGWHWVRNRSFRTLHLAAILLVAAEALVGIACPLTVWEHTLRGPGAGAPEDFVPRWVSRLLFYDFPSWVFTVLYLLFAAAVAAAWRFVPPLPRRRR
jgi:hypothetical protein